MRSWSGARARAGWLEKKNKCLSSAAGPGVRVTGGRTCPASSFLVFHGGGSERASTGQTAGSARGFGYCLRVQWEGDVVVTNAAFVTGRPPLLCRAGCKLPAWLLVHTRFNQFDSVHE
jgi:hypothetical protein